MINPIKLFKNNKKEEKKISILYFDIETTPVMFAGWRLGKTDLRHNQVLKRSEVMCISWAWNDNKVQHDYFDLSMYDWYDKDDNADFRLVKKFTDMAQKADLVIGHNAKNFDVANLRSRIVKYRLPDFKPDLIDDTYLASKDIGFLSHKLDDIGDFLGFGHKANHGNDMEWWIEVMRGNNKILKDMVHYCDVDVVRLREIYKALSPYIQSTLNAAVFFERPDACTNPLCGQSERPMIIRGYKNTKAGKFPKFQCPVCNKYVVKGKNKLKNSADYNR